MAHWPLKVAPEVAAAILDGGPVVVLETSIVAQGLPAPYNLEAALGCEAAIRVNGGIPATVAVREGALQVGLSEGELRSLAEAEDVVKVSTRDLGAAIALGWTGATTVAATVRAAALAGIRFMATGGIGGVHIGHPEDVSADLYELAQSPVAVFCAGAKTVLDLALTMERLESYQVPVLGWQTDDLPGFYLRRTGHPVSATVSGPEEAAAVLRDGWGAGLHGGGGRRAAAWRAARRRRAGRAGDRGGGRGERSRGHAAAPRQDRRAVRRALGDLERRPGHQQRPDGGPDRDCLLPPLSGRKPPAASR